MAWEPDEFFGFEDGSKQSFQDNNPSDTTIVTTPTPYDGTYALSMVYDAEVQFEWFATNRTDNGDYYILGFAIRFTGTYPNATINLVQIENNTGGNHLELELEADGDFVVRDANNTVQATLTDPFEADRWYFIEVAFQNVNSGNLVLHIDGNEEISLSAKDWFYSDDIDHYTIRNNATTWGETIFLDNIYTMSGAAGAADFIGPDARIAGPYNNTVAGATDVGATLDDGTWADTSVTPPDDVQEAGYSNSGLTFGSTRCDEGTRLGPLNGTPDLTGATIIAAKWQGRLYRGNGSATTHRFVYGNHTYITNVVVQLDTTPESFSAVSKVGATETPEADEIFEIGLRKGSGNREIYSYGLWCFLLYLPSTARRIFITHA